MEKRLKKEKGDKSSDTVLTTIKTDRLQRKAEEKNEARDNRRLSENETQEDRGT